MPLLTDSLPDFAIIIFTYIGDGFYIDNLATV